jgi:hypothetical protein
VVETLKRKWAHMSAAKMRLHKNTV